MKLSPALILKATSALGAGFLLYAFSTDQMPGPQSGPQSGPPDQRENGPSSMPPRGGGQMSGGPMGRGPTPEMLAACSDKAAGQTCSATGPQGNLMSGTCFAPQGRPLACRPSGAGPGQRQGQAGNGPPGGPPMNQQGAEIPSTRADTSGVLCGAQTRQQNPTLGIASTASWNCASGQRTLASNAIPDHTIGAFPNQGNPNRVTAQSISFSTTTTPVARAGAGAFARTIGYALNGVKFEPGTAGACEGTITSASQCNLGRGNGPWRTEALGQTVFDFGVDVNLAHVQPTGEYHYHGVPSGVLNAANKSGRAMQLIGWAADGFPIYARLGHDNARILSSPLRAMTTSYRRKATPDAGRPSTNLIPMGAFTQDWEYVSGLGDLDECNGRFGVTPEFPNGVYHYYATDAYPYVQRCVKGTAEPETRGGPPPGQGGGPPPGQGRRQ
jgi:hypothetical protein